MIIHHQVNNDGHHLPHDFSTLGYLAAVDVAVPGGSGELFPDQFVEQLIRIIKNRGRITIAVQPVVVPLPTLLERLQPNWSIAVTS